jgi:formylglycine-generating enzyme required for sulfatase activity
MSQEADKTGKELERWVADAYRQMGARKVEHDKEIAGHQIDVYVELEMVDRSVHRLAVEAKDHSSPVGIRIVSDFSDIVDRLRRERLIDEGIIVSAADFSRPARNAAQTYCIRLLEPADLHAMVAEARRRAIPSQEPSYETTKLPSKPSPEAPATIIIPAGPFWRGSLLEDPDAHENEKPRGEVNLPVAYKIGRYPVTNAQYACFLTDNSGYPVPYSAEEEAHSCNWDLQARIYPEGKADHPVVLVCWDDAMAYCRWLSQVTGKHYRLPTEEEWEKAARGALPEARRYLWGNEWRLRACNTQELGQGSTTSVRKFERTNQSPFGVVDMVGNVWEWTASWYERYPGSLHEGVHFGRVFRVVRGGSWRNSQREARISCRGRYPPDVRRTYVGFRIASDVDV